PLPTLHSFPTRRSSDLQASRYPPATCRCPCQGRNHGILRYRNPVINVTGQKTHDQEFAKWMERFEESKQIAPLPLLPHVQIPRTDRKSTRLNSSHVAIS